jgi:hypothetical protein
MLKTARNLRVALFTSLALLPAAAALAAQPAESASTADSPGLMVLLIAFCVMVVGLLAYTARRMATLE